MKKAWALLAIPLLAAAAASLVVYQQGRKFEIIHPHRGDITEAVYGLGKVKSNKRFEVILGVMSTVSRRHVNEGDLVKKGAPLIEFDSHAVFRAPFDGTVTFASVYPGETALPHTPVLRIEDLNERYIELSLEQQAALRVRRGQTAKISLESVRGQVLPGKVASIFPREDEFLARIDVEGLDASVLPGMTADVTVEIGKINDALLIPLKAVQNGTVSVRRSGRWQKIKVDVGHIDGLSAEVIGDALSSSDEIRVRSGG